MSKSAQGVDLLFLWHHHQPDYRRPRDGRALLPWVRLHATKDYLDMALHLECHPGVKATFNFAPSLLSQIEGALAGGEDALFDLLGRAPSTLATAERAELQSRSRMAPRWARDRWPQYQALCDKLRAPAVASDAELLRLNCYFLLAWLDPMLLEEPAAARAEKALLAGHGAVDEREGLLLLHAELLGRVLPAYRSLAARGQIEVSCSPAFHPILPLLVDVKTARRARPDQPSPTQDFAAPEDARWQIERGLALAESTFGARPKGMWPSEGSVSPEAAALLSSAGVQWVATDELVLWRSLGESHPRREQLYQPWRFQPPGAPPLVLFFRDHELSDRIGFVYSTWTGKEAAADFMRHLRRIGVAHAAAGRPGRPVVSVILDGENCWEHFADDGRPFLEALYTELEAAADVRTVTPTELLSTGASQGELRHLHSGSWIDADFHIWVGHPEKNRAWDLLARTRAALVEQGCTRDSHPDAWDSLAAAEGSDWFWWFGEDHYTADKALFDSLFRAHLQGVYEQAGMSVPGWMALPVASAPTGKDEHREPTGLIHPVIDGRLSRYYEWHGAGAWHFGTGGSAMHRVTAPVANMLHYGFDLEALHLRLDMADDSLPGAETSLVIEILAPTPMQFRVPSLAPGRCEWTQADGSPAGQAAVEDVLEVSLAFRALGVKSGQALELMLHVERDGERLESLPPGRALRVTAPSPDWDAVHWSA